MNIMRSEYPRPQLVRDAWLCLNGEWQFEIDNSKSGMERKLYKNDVTLNTKINVPFCPESRLSGIGNTDFMECVWYKRKLICPAEWSGKRIMLHFGAVDYHAVVFVNERKIAEHRGGFTPFSVDITDELTWNEECITLCAYDDLRSHEQPSGKQSLTYASRGCYYTRTTGIWQTVWLEAVNDIHIKTCKLTPNVPASSVNIECAWTGSRSNISLEARAVWNGTEVGRTELKSIFDGRACFSVPVSEMHLWDVGVGALYDLEIVLKADGVEVDRVASYFGLRTVTLENGKFKLNGKTVFGRWVLDQGFYPDGIYTAPTDDALKADIVNSMKLGFNGARLHEKIFEPRFLYWADKMGYLCWGEHANWGLDITHAGSIRNFLSEWLEAIERDYSHPSIIGWCPFNETWDLAGRRQDDSVLSMVYRVTKALDPTRPVIDTSGNYHVETDIFDVHDYEQDPIRFAGYYSRISEGIIEDQIERNPARRGRQKYDGKLPVFVSEYGGIAWIPNEDEGWGYGKGPKNEEKFLERYRGLTDALLDNEHILGFCYTQLFDVEQEKNGLMTYDRSFKFDPDIIRSINQRKAAVEND